MKYLMSILAIVMFSFAIAGCSAASPCDEFCEKYDECYDTSDADTCKSTWASAVSANAEVSNAACQDALDAMNVEGACGSADDDDSSS